jgi:hypothetical protein
MTRCTIERKAKMNVNKKTQGITRSRGEDQPMDKERAQRATVTQKESGSRREQKSPNADQNAPRTDGHS